MKNHRTGQDFLVKMGGRGGGRGVGGQVVHIMMVSMKGKHCLSLIMYGFYSNTDLGMMRGQ